MTLIPIETIPSGLTMIERAELYVDTVGTHYAVFRPSPQGVDGRFEAYWSETPIELEAADLPSVPTPA